MSNRLPLIAKLAQTPPLVSQPHLSYDPEKETIILPVGRVGEVWATRTQVTKQVIDPTSDEQTDR